MVFLSIFLKKRLKGSAIPIGNRIEEVVVTYQDDIDYGGGLQGEINNSCQQFLCVENIRGIGK